MTGAVESSPQPPASPDAVRRRAAAAVEALRERHLRRLGHLVPGTRIGVSSWPPVGRFGSVARLKASWNYWWQAHLVDVLVDAAVLGDRRAAGEATALVRGIRLRNVGRWTNEYYDDMAWLALALLVLGLAAARWLLADGFSALWGALTFPVAATAGLWVTLWQVQPTELHRLIAGVVLVIATLVTVPILALVLKAWAQGRLPVRTNAAIA